MTICVTPDGVRFIVGNPPADAPPPTCTVSCSRESLMQIIRGELDATNAIVGGLVMVDDIAQIMCFKMAFALSVLPSTLISPADLQQTCPDTRPQMRTG